MTMPKSKPQMKEKDVLKLIKKYKIDREKHPVVLVGVRGYYLDTMGVKGENDRGIFDDAAFILTPNGFFSFNFNTDPSAYRKGEGYSTKKGMACLMAGLWWYKIGLHKGKPAYRQAAHVTVMRDGIKGDYPHTGDHAINIHWAPPSGRTSSEGCQTVPYSQWSAFKSLLDMELNKYGQGKKFPYILVENA
jgi:hypothetical protein